MIVAYDCCLSTFNLIKEASNKKSVTRQSFDHETLTTFSATTTYYVMTQIYYNFEKLSIG